MRTSRILAFFCGGVPLYHLCLDPRVSFEKNVEVALLDEYAPLFREPESLLREELREAPRYNAVLHALSGGSRTYREIAKATGLEERGLDYHVRRLTSLGYVGRRYPLTGEPPNRRAVRFVLEDPLLRSWFRFVFPNQSFIRQMGPRRTLVDRVRPALPSYLGAGLESLRREARPRSAQGGPGEPEGPTGAHPWSGHSAPRIAAGLSAADDGGVRARRRPRLACFCTWPVSVAPPVGSTPRSRSRAPPEPAPARFSPGVAGMRSLPSPPPPRRNTVREIATAWNRPTCSVRLEILRLAPRFRE